MALTLDDIARHPELVSSSDCFKDMLIVFRPLLPTDELKLTEF